jgi:hypothetical protein
MTPPLACRLKLSETASAPELARLTGDTGLDLETKGLLLSASLECDLDRFTEKTLARFTIDGVSGVLASERVRWLEGVDIEVKSQLYRHVSTTR